MDHAAVSPLARTHRFGVEIRKRRELAGLSQDKLARRAGISRTDLSRIESPDLARRPDGDDMRCALRALVDEGSDEYSGLERLIWDATQKGWWRRWPKMGIGQQIVAAAECGAKRICAFQPALIPGLVQTPEYALCRARAVPMEAVNVESMIEGRLRRQKQVADAGTRYELIIREQVLYWMDDSKVLEAQLLHLLELSRNPQISVRVLPLRARPPAGWAPTSPYSIYEYPDPSDPLIVLTDVVGEIPTPRFDPEKVDLYVQLHDGLAGAALSDVDSAECIRSAAAWVGSR